MTDSIRERLQAALGTQYSLGRELGGGGMSRVFVARDETLGRDVVVKALSPAIAQELSAERFTREIRLAAALQHAHIVPLLSAGTTADGLPYYLMPYVEGESLRTRLATGRGLPIDETMLVLEDTARALAYAHARGVVHRDIKPDNVMLSGGAAVVTDFGIAKAVTSARAVADDDTLTRMGTSIGTPAYMAPEQGAGDPDTDHRADIYALGAMAYELLTGTTPFGARPPHALLVAHLSEPPVPVQERRPDTPAPLAALVMRCLAKDPAHRPQTANEILTELGVARSTGAITSAGPAASRPATPSGLRRRAPLAVAALLVVAAAIAAGTQVRTWMQKPAGTDATLIAVMPFNVRDAAHAVWREGLVDVLSRSLDGAGALRTVAPSTVIARTPERADAAAAATLGRDVGAGLVLLGDLTAVGRDSVHLRAAIYDVAAGRVRTDIDVQGPGARMDALADSLSIRVLREIGAGGGLGTRLYSVGTRSLPALKAFLRGQQFYRRALSDSARAAYQSAVELDSTFSLAWRGLAALYIRAGRESDPEAQRALDLAIRYKSGRSPRDSMLLRADSLRLAVVRRAPGQTDMLDPIAGLPPLFRTLQEATSQYPSDAELWFEYGDAAFHFGELAGVPQASSLAAFERGIELDSTFIVPYFHAAELALRDGRTALVTRFYRRMASLVAKEQEAYYRLAASLLDAPAPFSREARHLLDSLPARYPAAMMRTLATTPDSAATALSLARLLRETPPPVVEPVDSSALKDAITHALAARGRFREALAVREGRPPDAMLFALARLGAVPRDSALERARVWMRGDPRRGLGAVRLFAEARDTASLAVLTRWADSVEALPAAAATPVRNARALRAFTTFARGDSAGALQQLLAIPMAECGGVPCAGGFVAALLAAAGRDAEAARVLDRWMTSAYASLTTPLEMVLRARLAQRLGDDALAATMRRRVLTLWGEGDPPVRAAVDEAKGAAAR